MRRDAQPTGVMDLAELVVDQLVAYAVPPVDHLARFDAQRQPVPGLGDDLLAQDHEQVVPGVETPQAVPPRRVVFGGRDRVQPGRPGTRRQLRYRQLPAVGEH